MTRLYQERQIPSKEQIRINHVDYNILTWGDPAKNHLYLLHGWADVGGSFQFLVDELGDSWFCIAPDWRGFGDSGRSESYWFPDYLLDLDLIINHYSHDKQVRIAGHSMGGNIAWLYGGVRPDRISHLVSLDAFGLPYRNPDEAPGRYTEWLDQMQQEQQMKDFADMSALAEHIISLAPGLSQDRAEYVARLWGESGDNDRVVPKTDPAHKRINPILYRREEALSCWSKITAKTAIIIGGKSFLYKNWADEGGKEETNAAITDLREFVLDETGHMMHLQQPAKLARIVSEFFEE